MTEDEERAEMDSAESLTVMLGAMILGTVALLAFGLGWFASVVLR